MPGTWLREVVAMLATAMALSACGGAPPEPTATPSPTTLPDAAVYAQALFTDTNSARGDAGVPLLTWSECAADLALPRALHTLPEGTLTHEPLLPSCEDFTYMGENLSRADFTPAQVMDAWLDSPGHRQNLLDPDFTEVGIGCVAYDAVNPSVPATGPSSVGGMACSQVFLGYVP
jgi:uncharacterized protein YkwD